MVKPVIPAVLIAVGLTIPTLALAQPQDSMLIVTGLISGNVVGFNLTNGASVEFVALAPDNPPGTGDRPRGIAVGPNHLLHVSLRGGAQNIKRFWWDGNFIDDFVPSFSGPIGPGQIEFTSGGDLIVAGDIYEDSSVFRYDGTTGELLDQFRVDGFTNLVGLLVNDPYVYAAATFQEKVLRFDLSQVPVTGTPFITCCTGQPIGMAMSHRGTILVTHYTNTVIQEFDGTTGEFIGTFADLSSYGIPRGLDITYDSSRQRYYFTSFEDRIFELDHSGNVSRILESEILSGAFSLTIATPPISLLAPSESMALASALTITPNPSRGTVRISMDSRADEHPHVSRIYDVAGRMVRQLEESPMGGSFLWDGRDSQGVRSPAGTYFLRVSQGSLYQEAKIVVLP